MNSKTTFRKTAFIFFFSIYLALSPVQVHQANAWDAVFGAIAKNLMDYIRENLRGIITGAMKQAAMKMVTESISGMVGGSGSGDGKIISDYKDYLYTETEEKASVYINDYISQTTGGQSSGSYISAEGIGDYFPSGAGGTDYIKGIAKNTLSSIIGSNVNAIKRTYIGDPGENLFSGGNLDNFNSYLSSINNPWAYDLHIQQIYQKKLSEEREIARTKALISMGYKNTEKNGKVITPASFIASQMSDASSMNFDVITNANSLSEVVVGMVSTFVSQSIQNGIGKAADGIDKEGQNSENSQNSQTPGEEYGSGGGEAKPWVNPDNPT